MLRLLTILALLIAITAVIFALQNSTPVLVQFLGWQAQESMALVLLLTFTFGVLFGLLVSLPAVIKSMRKISRFKRQLLEQSYEIETLNRNLTEAKNQLQVLHPQVTQLQINPPESPSDMPIS